VLQHCSNLAFGVGGDGEIQLSLICISPVLISNVSEVCKVSSLTIIRAIALEKLPLLASYLQDKKGTVERGQATALRLVQTCLEAGS
jgi:hypothetical protein